MSRMSRSILRFFLISCRFWPKLCERSKVAMIFPIKNEKVAIKISRHFLPFKYNVPLNICTHVYYAIFYSYLNIGCNVWSFTSEKNIEDIQILQNKCIRIMTFAPFNSNTDQSFIDLSLLKVNEVIQINQLKVVYDFYDKTLPEDLMTFGSK